MEAGFEREGIIRRGFESGFEQAYAFGIEARLSDAEDTLAVLQDVLSERVEISERSAGLFAGLVAIAAAARLQYGEPPLAADDIRHYLQHSAQFFNSFFHP